MPTITTTVEDNSPLLTFDGWIIGASNGPDGLITSYSERNFMATTTQNATMTFNYNGTDVTLYGAQRGNHGRYQVTVDHTTYDPQSGYAADPGKFQVTLFESHGLQQGNHTVKISDIDGGQWLDIDFVTWTSTFGDPNAQLAITAVDDGDSAFGYSGTDWANNPTDVGKYFGGTGHSTSTYNAKMQFKFTVGDAISLYGPVGSIIAPYSVQMDLSTPINYNPNRSPSFQILLYHANNLGPGNHTMTFTCLPVQQQQCGVDYVNIYRTANGSSAASTLPNSSDTKGNTGHSNNSYLSAGDIAGIGIGSAAVALAIAFVVLYMVARRRSTQTTTQKYGAIQPIMAHAPAPDAPSSTSISSPNPPDYYQSGNVGANFSPNRPDYTR